MIKNNYLPMAVALLSLSTLTGFADFFVKDDALDNVRNFTEEVKSTMHANDKLTGMETAELKQYEAYKFTAKDSNPFAVKNFVQRANAEELQDNDGCMTPDCGDGPPVAHAKYFLENYSMEQLLMIGSMKFSSRGRVALIQTPNAGVVHAAKGEYIGRNNGLILSVEKNRLIVREKYRSPKGWQDRMAKLPLTK